MQMFQRMAQPASPFGNPNHANLPSIWQPMHPSPLISQQQMEFGKPAEADQQEIGQHETGESALENDLGYLEIA